MAAGKSHGRTGSWSKQVTKNGQKEPTLRKQSTICYIGTQEHATINDSSVSTLHPSSFRFKSKGDAIFVNTSSRDMKFFYDINHDTKFRIIPSNELGNFGVFDQGYSNIFLKNAFLASYPGPVSSILPWDSKGSENNAMLLSFFENVMCARNTFIDDSYHNIMRRIILPIGLNSDIVYNAILMAAAHYMRFLDQNYFVTEIKYRQRTLAGLRSMLECDAWNADVLVLAVIMLCSFDVSPPVQYFIVLRQQI